jgi:hypothetical protein
MIVGEPYIAEKIEAMDQFDRNAAGLRRESDRLMRTLARLLPENKRGTWQERLDGDPGHPGLQEDRPRR